MLNYNNTIQELFDSLKIEKKLKWVYYKIANFDSIDYSNNQPPSPNFISTLGFTNFEINTENLKDIQVLNFSPTYFIAPDPEKTVNDNIEKNGFGLVFSMPYTFSNNESKFIDVELINWSFCGTGTNLTVEMKE